MRPLKEELSPRVKNLIGDRYGLLTVIDYWCRDGIAHQLWLCRCDCGAETLARGNNMRTGNTISCGCKHTGGRKTERHGYHSSRTYTTWEKLKARCQPGYFKSHLYYDKGITVCDRWADSFQAFLEDMGERPKGTTLDRIDGTKGYSKDNCRWVSILVQNRNTATTAMVDFKGKRIPRNDVADMFGINAKTLQGRLLRGMTIEEAVKQ